MKKTALITLILLVVGQSTTATAAENEKPRMLSHDVYFALEDNSETAKKDLVGACKKYLSDHPGIVWFDAAVLVQEHQREVNDRDFDVALHVLFKDKASHDRYQDAPKHHQFIEENRENWKKVRVFDSWVMVTAHSEQAAEGK